jgi:hypothetical protein
MSAATTTIRSSTRAGSSTRLSAHLAHPRQPLAQRGLVVWQAGRADSGEVSEAALSAHAVHLLARLLHPRDGRSVHARAVHGFPRRSEGGRAWATSTCSGPAFLVAPVTEQGADQPFGVPAGRRGLVQLLDQPAPPRRADGPGGRSHRHPAAVRSGRLHSAPRRTRREHQRNAKAGPRAGVRRR